MKCQRCDGFGLNGGGHSAFGHIDYRCDRCRGSGHLSVWRALRLWLGRIFQ